MEFLYNGRANRGGIYIIRNKNNGKFYIGSCKLFKKRFESHVKSLKAGKHQNILLQRAWNKYGKESFEIEAIEVVEGKRRDRLLVEQKYLNQFFDNKKNCYNLCPTAGSREGSKNARPYNPKTDGRAKPKTQEWLEDVSAKNKKLWNKPERKQEASQHANKRWSEHSANIVVTNKHTGETVTINGSVRQFCLERGLSYKSFNQLVKGKTKFCNGWFLGTTEPKYKSQKGQKRNPLTEEHREKISQNPYIGVKLHNEENGKVYTINKSLKKIAEELGVSYSSLTKLLAGKCKSAGRWSVS